MEPNSKNSIRGISTDIPVEVSQVTRVLEEAGFEAYLVGGCVRDLVMSEMLHEKPRIPKDWDLTTNAKPDQIVALFEKTIYENNFGTVGVCVPVIRETQYTSPQPSPESRGRKKLFFGQENTEDEVSQVTQSKNVSRETLNNSVTHETSDLSVIPAVAKAMAGKHETLDSVKRETIISEGVEYMLIEVTPYRTEAKYSDFRHPDEIEFSDKLEDDLKRRDFTVNAMVINSKGQITDMFDGLKDIENKILRTVGQPDERFTEDALRMLRAVRFACQLNFSISTEATDSIVKNADLIKKISTERIRDEFSKIIMSSTPAMGVVMLQKFGLLKHFIPELEEGIGCEQGGVHIYDVWNHLLMALQHAADKDWPLEIRLAALFHDIGKPRTRRPGEKKAYTFYGHEVVGARMAKKIMERLKFPRKETDLVETFVRQHMFFSDTEKITLSAVRRIIAKVGKENIWLLMNIRECDRVGMKKTEAPYRLRKYFAMIEEALRDPISVKQLKVDGNYLMNELHMKPGPRMGWVLNALLEEVLEDPTKNEIEYLKNRVEELEKLPDSDLRELGEKGKEAKEELEEEEVGKLHAKHGVRSSKDIKK